MTITNATQRFSYAGDGATVAFAYSARFLADADLAVLLVTDSTGIGVLQTITTEYTVAGAGVAGGGTVTMVTAPASGETLRIYGDPALTQSLDLIAGGPLPAESVEDALDLAVIQQKRTRELSDRSLHLPDEDAAGISTELPNVVDRASMVLGFDAAGEPALFSATAPTFSGFTANRAIQSDGAGAAEASAVTATELAAIAGASATPANSIIPIANGSGKLADGWITKSSVDQHRNLTKSFTLESPTNAEDFVVWRTPVAITITNINVVLEGTSPSLTVDPYHDTDNSAAGNDILAAPEAVVSETTGEDITPDGDATVPANSFVKFQTTALSGTVDKVSVTFEYTED